MKVFLKKIKKEHCGKLRPYPIETDREDHKFSTGQSKERHTPFHCTRSVMATLHFPPFTLARHPPAAAAATTRPPLPSYSSWLHLRLRRPRPLSAPARAYKVVVEHEGRTTELEVEPDETILSKAIDSGLDVPHDCKLGVCMTCPARLVSGSVDQSDGMLSDDVVERGYALLCAAYPRSDCVIKTIPEEELLSLQLATAND